MASFNTNLSDKDLEAYSPQYREVLEEFKMLQYNLKAMQEEPQPTGIHKTSSILQTEGLEHFEQMLQKVKEHRTFVEKVEEARNKETETVMSTQSQIDNNQSKHQSDPQATPRGSKQKGLVPMTPMTTSKDSNKRSRSFLNIMKSHENLNEKRVSNESFKSQQTDEVNTGELKHRDNLLS